MFKNRQKRLAHDNAYACRTTRAHIYANARNSKQWMRRNRIAPFPITLELEITMLSARRTSRSSV